MGGSESTPVDPTPTEPFVPHGRAMRTQMTPQQIANLAALSHSNGTHSAPPIHDQATFDRVVTQVDTQNLQAGIGGDVGASHEDWHGSTATAAGISAHNARMQSNITREGDHGEPTGALATALDVMDAVPMFVNAPSLTALDAVNSPLSPSKKNTFSVLPL